MKLPVIAGWILLVIELLIIGSMLVQPNAGGRGEDPAAVDTKQAACA